MLARTMRFLERKLPEHTPFRFVEALPRRCDAPEAHVLPAPHAQFVKERNGVTAFNGSEQRKVRRIQILISAPPVSCVENRVARAVHAVWIARVDATEICKQRDETTIFLIDAIPDSMRVIDFIPRENFRGRKVCARLSRSLTRRRALCFSRLPGRHTWLILTASSL